MLDLSQTPVTLLLLGVNILLSLFVLMRQPALLDRLSLVPVRVLQNGEIYRLVTAGFVHVNGTHLLVNMITLYFFGPWMEITLGSAAFLLLYFGAELAAHGVSLVIHRRNPRYAAVGASGAISGVLFAFCLYEPFRLLFLFFVIPIPAIVFAIGFVIVSLIAMRRQAGQVGGFAHEAHLGGALGGVVIAIALNPAVLPALLQTITLNG
ncbi:rhomboid family intramembrane serine protease [Halomonas vilamensis]|uniref:Rhomboid family intramembrane serine protease n=1 Tax=Vreelandella vilamensis TaxID=531309 RepID=A0ABU1H4K1_9GAMM|nr:rhomboid family intramembrane serine protease [Halomonas vilamensis]MDR5899224.1 rhomboid family intramembrane serine protease [Halomonas vilamensis]